jgi:tRNA dimethylallyltransferase
MIEKQEHKVIYDNVRFLFLNPSREKLYENINERVDEMINNGLVDEVKHLLDKYQLSMTAVQAIGYKEIISYLNNEISYEESVELIKKRTRNYAKRQVTFFKHQFVSEQYETVVDLLKGVLGNE